MAKKPTTKDCIKFVCDGLDTINDTMINKNKELGNQSQFLLNDFILQIY